MRFVIPVCAAGPEAHLRFGNYGALPQWRCVPADLS